MNELTRRSFMALGAAALAVPRRAMADPAPMRLAAKRRRVLFNWDGSMIHCWGRAALDSADGPLTREQFVSLVFAPIEDTAVDAVFFSFGSGNVAEYQSDVLEWPGEADGFKFPDSRSWHGGIEVDPKDQYQNPKGLADAGHNPPAVIVQECHRRGMDAFVSLRMNDCHDGQHPRGTLPNPELPTFKRQNPDWLVQDLDWWTALDFSVPKVRALKLKVIEEFFQRWDFDGIELDWLRHTLYFPRGTERENGKYLTDFMREVRGRLDELARRRGRPIEVAVRVPERLAWCLEGGFDVPAWITEDLVDLLILGQGVTDLANLAEFRELMTARNLPIYPSIYAYGNGYRLSPDEVIRATAANLWRDGADGLYTFNWFYHGSWRSWLLREIGEPRLLAGKDKHYTLPHRLEATPGGPGADHVRYNTMKKDAPVPFRLNVADGTKTVLIPVADDFSSASERPKSAELWIAADYLAAGDVFDLTLNEKRLDPPEIDAASHVKPAGYAIAAPQTGGLLGFPPDKSLDTLFPAVRLNVPLELLVPGRNKLAIRLTERAPGAEHPLRITRVELSTRF